MRVPGPDPLYVITVTIVAFELSGLTITLVGMIDALGEARLEPSSYTREKLTFPKKDLTAVTVIRVLAFWPSGMVSWVGEADIVQHSPGHGTGFHVMAKPWILPDCPATTAQ